MDVFNFSGSVEYNYGEKRKVSGYFVQEDDVVKGYVQETGTKYTPSAIKGVYDVETGKEKYDLKTNMFPREGSDDISSLASTRLFGNDGKYIYYEYSFNDSSNIYYGKVSMDLSNVEVITKDEIPNELL